VLKRKREREIEGSGEEGEKYDKSAGEKVPRELKKGK
jgi:hypothetical protein